MKGQIRSFTQRFEGRTLGKREGENARMGRKANGFTAE